MYHLPLSAGYWTMACLGSAFPSWNTSSKVIVFVRLRLFGDGGGLAVLSAPERLCGVRVARVSCYLVTLLVRLQKSQYEYKGSPPGGGGAPEGSEKWFTCC